MYIVRVCSSISEHPELVSIMSVMDEFHMLVSEFHIYLSD